MEISSLEPLEQYAYMSLLLLLTGCFSTHPIKENDCSKESLLDTSDVNVYAADKGLKPLVCGTTPVLKLEMVGGSTCNQRSYKQVISSMTRERERETGKQRE